MQCVIGDERRLDRLQRTPGPPRTPANLNPIMPKQRRKSERGNGKGNPRRVEVGNGGELPAAAGFFYFFLRGWLDIGGERGHRESGPRAHFMIPAR